MKTFLKTLLIATCLLIGCSKMNDPPTCKGSSATCAGAICADLYHGTSCDPDVCVCHGGVDRWLCDV